MLLYTNIAIDNNKKQDPFKSMNAEYSSSSVERMEWRRQSLGWWCKLYIAC